jgi:hypothetical protein
LGTRLGNGSRVNREVYARFCEEAQGEIPGPTHHGDAVGVSAEIAQGMLGTTEGRFAIDHPVMPEQLAEPRGEDLGLSEPFQISIEAKFSFGAGALQGCHKLTAKNSTQYFDGKKERVAGVDPAGVI